MLRRIARFLLVFMILWLPMQGQAMMQLAPPSDEPATMAMEHHHEGCPMPSTSSDMDNLPGGCHDMNHCQLCHTAPSALPSAITPALVSDYFSLSDNRPPLYFFEQPQRPPLG
jgi:hypothetical protein